MRDTEHVKFIYYDRGSLTCTFCQKMTPIVENIGEDMKRTYTIISIDEKDRNSGKRRVVVVELECRSEPDALGETESKIETVMVEYPAYGGTHYVHQVAHHPTNRVINFVDAKAIAKEILKCVEGD